MTKLEAVADIRKALLELMIARKKIDMAKERTTNRQKDISRLLREQKKTKKTKPHRPVKKK